jgi:hypothetical protein
VQEQAEWKWSWERTYRVVLGRCFVRHASVTNLQPLPVTHHLQVQLRGFLPRYVAARSSLLGGPTFALCFEPVFH